jgi:hypothetical protein
MCRGSGRSCKSGTTGVEDVKRKESGKKRKEM